MPDTTSIDLFCGAGGLTLGLAEAGFGTALASDNWEPALSTFERNFPEVPVLGADIRDLAGADLIAKAQLSEPPTAIVGGPPCQGFTSAGARRSDDARNTLVAEFARVVAEGSPKLVLFENVEGFLTMDKGAFVVDLLDPLIEAGYHLHVRKVNVANYGVPQLRKRVIVLGMLGGDPGFPPPTHHAYGAPGAERLDALHLPRTPSAGDVLDTLPPPSDGRDAPSDHVVRSVGTEERKRITALGPGQTMRDLPETLQHASYRRRANRRVSDGTPTERRGGAPAGLRRLRGDEPSTAITSAAIRALIHPTQDRPLTLRECAALQTFPDEFHFAGNASDRATLIGNAIPPRFAGHLGVAMFQAVAATTAMDVGRGQLLSFEPTPGTGMSPALQSVTRLVSQRYGVLEQTLWR